jgi:hypothetical protein
MLPQSKNNFDFLKSEFIVDIQALASYSVKNIKFLKGCCINLNEAPRSVNLKFTARLPSI